MNRCRLVLVACSASKLGHAAPARDLYGPSDLFAKSRTYAEHLVATDRADAWLILSAKHGLVTPGRILEPYEQSLAGMPPAARREWGARVATLLIERGAGSVLFLAGRMYRGAIAQHLDRARIHHEAPMAQMEIGQQKAWLKQQVDPSLPLLFTEIRKNLLPD